MGSNFNNKEHNYRKEGERVSGRSVKVTVPVRRLKMFCLFLWVLGALCTHRLKSHALQCCIPHFDFVPHGDPPKLTFSRVLQPSFLETPPASHYTAVND